MKTALASVALMMVGCGFYSSGNDPDARPINDGRPPPVDVPVPPDAAVVDGGVAFDAVVPDAPPDAAPAPPRVRDRLIGLWELNETSGTTLADTSGVAQLVPLTVRFGTVSFAGGAMATNGETLISADQSRHLNSDVTRAGAVTLEAWVTPAAATQGSAAQPAHIAGLTSSIVSRNISLLQAGDRWIARVRTSANVNGGPDLVSSEPVQPGAVVHLVVVAEATRRALYVNGRLSVADVVPGGPVNWDNTYRMTLANEPARGRAWSGAFGLVAMYDQALSEDAIATNFAAGPEGE